MEAEKHSWPEQSQLHSVGMGMVHYMHGEGGEAGGMTATDLASTLGMSHVPEMSQETVELHNINFNMEDSLLGHEITCVVVYSCGYRQQLTPPSPKKGPVP